MKTSEYIREHVYEYLAPSKYFHGNWYLCNCLKNRFGESFDYSRVINLIKENLLEGSILLDVTYSPDYSIEQTERFMFAEFMALYFEDLGD